ncbi:hypothetical protein EJ04DRAFT_163998 [Polyplosphaeria fusca]|uniref:Uncharacterized protein n=1 Tax=Polyplosphaeria fusca TaxID=682080 RepID=A0A9P4R859_9PLEO|nr:hypothetical protein EJ04DRAFT_163998 [Polyplosphaeria fusca]
MFDLCSERLLESEERFAGRNGHRFVEIWDCGNGRVPTYRSGDLKEKEIAGWVHEDRSANGPVRSGLRILLSPKPSGRQQPSSGKLPYSQATFRSLCRAWRIPSTFLRAIAQKLSIVTRCSVSMSTSPEARSSGDSLPRSRTPSAPSSPRSPAAFSSFPVRSPSFQAFTQEDERESNLSDSSRCLIVRGDVDWTWDYTMLLILDPVSHMTYAIVVGLTATEIDLVSSYLGHPSTRLGRFPQLLTHPLLLPVLLLDLATDDTSNLLKIRIKMLSQIQQRTGMDRFNSLRGTKVSGRTSIALTREKERQELDLDAVMLRLTCLSDWVAAQRGFVRIQGRVAQTVDEMLSNEPTGNLGANETRGIESMFRERLEFAKESLLAAEAKCQYLERSINAQVQTIYSLIGQKDNRLNIAAASASCQIASDSRRIAILTRRDSTDMRIIAAVTLIFLPGTFVATIFSTGLFDWGYGDPTPSAGSDDGADSSGGGLVSKYLWVYFMLTGVLTFVVLVAWVLFSYIQNRNMLRQLSLDPEQDEELGFGQGNSEDLRRDSDMTFVNGKVVGRRSWAIREFEKWKEEAKGGLRWWGREGVKKEVVSPNKGEGEKRS